MNRAAAAQLAEGDIDAIYGIAEENGIDREDAEDYIDGAAPELCTPSWHCLENWGVEARELEPQEIMEDWLTYIRIQCGSTRRRRKQSERKRRAQGVSLRLLKWSFETSIRWTGEIFKGAKRA